MDRKTRMLRESKVSHRDFTGKDGRKGLFREKKVWVLLRDHFVTVMGVLILVGISTWCYRGILYSLWRDWQSNKDYSAGQLVPLIALFFIWRQRNELRRCRISPCWIGGIILLLLAQMVRMLSYLLMYWSVWQYSLVLTVGGLVLLVLGWSFFRRILGPLLLLFLMFPLPINIHNWISGPLQRLATNGSVFLLEVFGVRLTQQGNVIVMGNGIPIQVAEACSGLRMLTAFVIVAVFIAWMVKRARWHKAVLVASSILIAVVCNILRIFLTAMIMLYVSVEIGEKFFHDFAGLVMMPAAVSFIFGEIWLMDRIFETDETGSAGDQAEGVVRPVKKHQKGEGK